MMRREVVPLGRVIWQSEAAKSYKCPFCKLWVRSQYEGDVIPTVECAATAMMHILEWPEEPRH